MIPTMKSYLGTCALLALAACGSPQNSYYMLSQTPPGGAVPGSNRTVAIDDVSIPGQLDKPQIVIGLDENRVDVHEYDRWAEPFDGMVRRTLGEDLRARLGAGRVLEKPNKDSLALSVTIDTFGRQGDRVVLRGRWTLKEQGKDGAVPPHSFDEDLALDPNAPIPATVAGMSRLLGQVSDEMALSVEKR